MRVDAHSGNFGSLIPGEDKAYWMFDWANAFIGPPIIDAYMMEFAGTCRWEEHGRPTPSLIQFGKLWESFAPASDLLKALEKMPILSTAISLYGESRAHEMADAPYLRKIDHDIHESIEIICKHVKKQDDNLN